MTGRTAAAVLCGVGLVLVFLRVTGSVTSARLGGAFAVALLLLGVASRGFRARGDR